MGLAGRISKGLQRPGGRAFGVYLLVTLVYALLAEPRLFREHTAANHFALLAEGWLHGRLDLGGPPPAWAQMNDFAQFQGRWFIVFPPLPALLLVPWVVLCGGAQNVPDGLVFLLCAGVAPALLFLLLERLRALSSGRRTGENLALVALFAFGSVFFFTAVQGTVWFAAHVVAASLLIGFLLAALEAAHPWWAGVCIALGFLTRTPVLLAGIFMLFEVRRLGVYRRLVPFFAPVVVAVGVAAVLNWQRFGSPLDFGYRYLVIAWHDRIETWGCFSYHYLARNLGVVLTSLPWFEPHAPHLFRISGHGLALWVTTPAFLWLLWPARRGAIHDALAWTLLAVAAPTLLYQNTGWLQFGYRFSNDYSPLLIALLALGGRPLGAWFRSALVWSVCVNLLGALTFGRDWSWYHVERTQQILYQPD